MNLQEWITSHPEEAREAIKEWWDARFVAEMVGRCDKHADDSLGGHIRWCLEQGHEHWLNEQVAIPLEYEDITLDQRMRLAEAHQDELETNPYGRNEP